MDKESNILEYYKSNKALFLYIFGIIYGNKDYMQYILNDKYIKCAEVSTIANILLGIKEDMVETEENAIYESRLFNNILENCIENISKKTDDGYVVDNHTFKSSSELVAMLRNKIAHGKYHIDFKTNKIILNILNSDISISINKLKLFIAKSIQSVLLEKDSKNYKRSITMHEVKDEKRVKPLTLKSEIKSVIKNCRTITYEIKSKDDNIPRDCIQYFHVRLKEYVKTYNHEVINDISKYLKERNCTLNITSKRINNIITDEVYELIVAMYDIEKLDYKEQIALICRITQRYIDNSFNTIEPRLASFYNLLLLSEIEKLKTTDIKEIALTMFDKYSYFEINYDSLGISAINMFNSLFSYSFDDLYKNNNEFTSMPNNGLDYSKFDLSLLNITELDIDNTVLENEKVKNKSLENKVIELKEKYNEKINNLVNVRNKNNGKAIEQINYLLYNIGQSKIDSISLLNESNRELDRLSQYYKDNELYLKNKAIIEGIRNSIAHGHYEINAGTDNTNSKIIFSDIYEGKLTFKAEISILEFVQLLDANVNIIEEFILNRQNKNHQL